MSNTSPANYETLRTTIAAAGSQMELDSLHAIVRGLFTGVRRRALESAIAERRASVDVPAEAERGIDDDAEPPMAVDVLRATIATLEAAAETAKGLRTQELTANAGFRLADIVALLAQARYQLAELEDTLVEQDAKILEWREAFRAKGLLRRQHDAYYHIGSDGRASGDPLCLRCWEVDHQQNALIHDVGDTDQRVCTVCGTRYVGCLAITIP